MTRSQRVSSAVMVLLVVISFFIVSSALADQGKESAIEEASKKAASDVNTEDISELEQIYGEEVIVTASKRAQKIYQSPSSISVITAEDIRQSGATQIAEVLNTVTGVHFGYTTAHYMMAGGIRGLNKLPANKVIFMLDGVPWTFEVYGIPAFNPLPISMDEIDRIEILKGAGSSLYGPNAMTGVINVITKKPKDTQGNYAAITAGDLKTVTPNYIHGGSWKDKVIYRISYGWDIGDNFDAMSFQKQPESEIQRVNTNTDFIINDNSQLNFAGSYIHANSMYALQDSTGPIGFTNAFFAMGTVTYTMKEPNIMVRYTEQGQNMWDSGYYFGGRSLYFTMGRTIVEAQHTFSPFKNDVFSWGPSFTQLRAKGPTVGGTRRHDLSGYFVDNTYKFTEKFALNTALRYDHHPNTADSLTHRLSFLYDLTSDHHLRFTWATSSRSPDFIESYYNNPATGGGTGSQANNPEKLEMFELGYRGKLTEKLGLESNLFYNKVSDALWYVPNQSTSPYLSAHRNMDDYRQVGLELDTKYSFTEWLKGSLGYSYIESWEDKLENFNGGALYGTVTNGDFLKMTPRNMFNGNLRATFKNGFSSNLGLQYVGTSDWRKYTWSKSNEKNGGKAQSYLICNLRVGYKFKLLKNNAEVGLAAFDLFDHEFQDYPMANFPDIGRRITASLRYEF